MRSAAVDFISTACQLIDMRQHTGVHPCIGSADVIPFVPLGDTLITECADLAEQVAQKIGDTLQIPTFLYGKFAKRVQQNKLSTIRHGGYQSLAERLEKKEIIPDFGSPKVGSAGGTIIGSRPIMLAYNVNLANDNVPLASKIAGIIRTSGHLKRTPEGTQVREAGLFPNCEAIGWYIEDFRRAQVSTNIRVIGNPPIHEVYETVKKIAKDNGGEVTGSEIIGLLPLESLLEAQKYYRNALNFGGDFSAAIAGLGLTDVKPFDPSLKVLEHRLKTFNLL